MPRGAAAASGSTDASAVRAANTQASPTRKPFAPTRREAHRHAVLEQQRGAGGRDGDDAGRARRVQVLHLRRPCRRRPVRKIAPAWSQRLHAQIRRLRDGAVWAAPRAASSAGSAGVKRMRRFASSISAILRISPALLRHLAPVVGDLDPVADREAQHIVAAERVEFELGGRDDRRDAAGDARVVARPLEGGAGAGLRRRRAPRRGRAGSPGPCSRRSAAARTGRATRSRRRCRWSAARWTAR